MPHYRHKPSIIYAHKVDMPVTVKTLEGDMDGNIGDYLVLGTQGEAYIVKKAIFEDIYELIE